MDQGHQTEGATTRPRTDGSCGRRRRGCGLFGEGGRAHFRSGGRGEGGHGHGHSFGPGFGRGHRSRARRGDVRNAILVALADEPMHGYQIMQKLEERSGGAWRPSPGSVYPTLQMLEDQGLVEGEDVDGRRVFSLTGAGAEEAGKLRERLGDSPWGERAEADPRFALRQAAMALAGAVKQVAVSGTADDAEKALEILRDARKRVYALLADAE